MLEIIYFLVLGCIFVAMLLKLLRLDKYAVLLFDASFAVPAVLTMLVVIYIWIFGVVYGLFSLFDIDNRLKLWGSIALAIPLFAYVFFIMCGVRLSKDIFSGEYLRAIAMTLSEKYNSKRKNYEHLNHVDKLSNLASQIKLADGEFIFYLMFAVATYFFGYFLVSEIVTFRRGWGLNEPIYMVIVLAGFLFAYAKYYQKYTRLPFREMMSLVSYLEKDGFYVLATSDKCFLVESISPKKVSVYELLNRQYIFVEASDGTLCCWVKSDMSYKGFVHMLLFSKHGVRIWFEKIKNRIPNHS